MESSGDNDLSARKRANSLPENSTIRKVTIQQTMVKPVSGVVNHTAFVENNRRFPKVVEYHDPSTRGHRGKHPVKATRGMVMKAVNGFELKSGEVASRSGERTACEVAPRSGERTVRDVVSRSGERDLWEKAVKELELTITDKDTAMDNLSRVNRKLSDDIQWYERILRDNKDTLSTLEARLKEIMVDSQGHTTDLSWYEKVLREREIKIRELEDELKQIAKPTEANDRRSMELSQGAKSVLRNVELRKEKKELEKKVKVLEEKVQKMEILKQEGKGEISEAKLVQEITSNLSAFQATMETKFREKMKMVADFDGRLSRCVLKFDHFSKKIKSEESQKVEEVISKQSCVEVSSQFAVNLGDLGDIDGLYPGDKSLGGANPSDANPVDMNSEDGLHPRDRNPRNVNAGYLNPGDLSPGDLNPGDLNPGDLSPGDLNPGEVDPSPYEEQLNYLKDELRKEKKINDEIIERFLEIEESTLRYEDTIETLREKANLVDDLRTQNDSLVREISELREKEDSLMPERDSLDGGRKDGVEQGGTNRDEGTDGDELKDEQLDSLRAILECQQNEMNELREKAQEDDELIEELRANFQREEKWNREMNRKYEWELSTNVGKDEHIEELQECLWMREKMLEQLQEQLDFEDKRCEELLEKLVVTQKETQDFEEIQESFQRKLQEKDRRIMEFCEQNDRDAVVIATLTSENKQSRNETDAEKKARRVLEAEMERVNGLLDAVEQNKEKVFTGKDKAFEELSVQLEEEESASKGKDEVIENLREQVVSLSGDVEEMEFTMEETRATLEEELRRMREELGARRKELVDAAERYEELHEVCKTLREQISQKDDQILEREAESARHREVIVVGEKEIEELRGMCGDGTRLNNKPALVYTEEEMNEANEFLEDEKEVSEKLRAQIKLLEKAAMDSKNEFLEMMRKLEENDEDKRALVTTREELHARDSLLEETRGELHARDNLLDETRKELKENNDLLGKTREELHARDSLLEETRGELHARDNLLEETRGELHARDNLLDETRKELKENNDLLGKTREELHARDSLLEETRGELHARDSLLEETRGELHARDNLLDETRKELKENNDLLGKTREELHARDSLLEETRGELHARDNLLDETRKELKENNDLLGKTREELHASNDMLEKTREGLHARDNLLEETRKEVHTRDNLLEETRKKLYDNNALLENTRVELNARDSLLEKTREEVHARDEMLEETRKDSDARNTEVVKQKEAMVCKENELERYKEKLSKMDEEKVLVVNEEERKKELSSAKEETRKVSQENEYQKEEMSKMREAVERGEGVNENLRVELEKLSAKCLKHEDDLRITMVSNVNLKYSLEEHVSQSRAQNLNLRNYDQELEALRKHIHEMDILVSGFHNALEEAVTKECTSDYQSFKTESIGNSDTDENYSDMPSDSCELDGTTRDTPGTAGDIKGSAETTEYIIATPVTTMDAGGAPVMTRDTSGPAVTTWDTARSRVTTWDTAGSHVTTWDTAGSPVTTWDAAGTPVTTWDTAGSPVNTRDAAGTRVTTWDAGGTPVTSWDIQGMPVIAGDTGETPVTTGDTKGLSITTELPTNSDDTKKPVLDSSDTTDVAKQPIQQHPTPPSSFPGNVSNSGIGRLETEIAKTKNEQASSFTELSQMASQSFMENRPLFMVLGILFLVFLLGCVDNSVVSRKYLFVVANGVVSLIMFVLWRLELRRSQHRFRENDAGKFPTQNGHVPSHHHHGDFSGCRHWEDDARAAREEEQRVRYGKIKTSFQELHERFLEAVENSTKDTLPIQQLYNEYEKLKDEVEKMRNERLNNDAILTPHLENKKNPGNEPPKLNALIQTLGRVLIIVLLCEVFYIRGTPLPQFLSPLTFLVASLLFSYLFDYVCAGDARARTRAGQNAQEIAREIYELNEIIDKEHELVSTQRDAIKALEKRLRKEFERRIKQRNVLLRKLKFKGKMEDLRGLLEDDRDTEGEKEKAEENGRNNNMTSEKDKLKTLQEVLMKNSGFSSEQSLSLDISFSPMFFLLGLPLTGIMLSCRYLALAAFMVIAQMATFLKEGKYIKVEMLPKVFQREISPVVMDTVVVLYACLLAVCLQCSQGIVVLVTCCVAQLTVYWWNCYRLAKTEDTLDEIARYCLPESEGET